MPGEAGFVPSADHRPECYVEIDDSGAERVVYRASGLGGCLRRLVAARLGYTPVAPSANQERVMNEGVIHEPHVLAHLRTQGWVIRDEQRRVELHVGLSGGRPVIIRGHIDGVATRDTQRVVEVKAMGKDPFTRWAAEGFDSNRRYAYQLGTYMAGLGMPGLMAVKNRDSGLIDVREIDIPPVPFEEIRARVLAVERWAAEGDLPECDPVTWACPFFYLHEEHSDDPHALEPELDEALDALAATYDEARRHEAQAEKVRKEAGARLHEALAGRPKVQTPTWRVSWVTQKRSDVDLRALRSEHPEMAAEFTRTRVVEFPRVTRVDPDPGPIGDTDG